MEPEIDQYDILVDRLRKIDMSPIAFAHSLEVLRAAYVLGKEDALAEGISV